VTLAGTGAPGKEDGGFKQAQFSEPGGLCLNPEGKLLVVADTNNHVIRVLDLEKEVVTTVSKVEAKLPC
jgi:sugar lactone lactonase YvrE